MTPQAISISWSFLGNTEVAMQYKGIAYSMYLALVYRSGDVATAEVRDRMSLGSGVLVDISIINGFASVIITAETTATQEQSTPQQIKLELVSSSGNTITWKGGVAPYYVYIDKIADNGKYTNVKDEILEFSGTATKAFTLKKINPAEGHGWWASNKQLVDGGLANTEVGVTVLDSKGAQVFAPFAGLKVLNQNSELVEHPLIKAWGPPKSCPPFLILNDNPEVWKWTRSWTWSILNIVQEYNGDDVMATNIPFAFKPSELDNSLSMTVSEYLSYTKIIPGDHQFFLDEALTNEIMDSTSLPTGVDSFSVWYRWKPVAGDDEKNWAPVVVQRTATIKKIEYNPELTDQVKEYTGSSQSFYWFDYYYGITDYTRYYYNTDNQGNKIENTETTTAPTLPGKYWVKLVINTDDYFGEGNAYLIINKVPNIITITRTNPNDTDWSPTLIYWGDSYYYRVKRTGTVGYTITRSAVPNKYQTLNTADLLRSYNGSSQSSISGTGGVYFYEHNYSEYGWVKDIIVSEETAIYEKATCFFQVYVIGQGGGSDPYELSWIAPESIDDTDTLEYVLSLASSTVAGSFVFYKESVSEDNIVTASSTLEETTGIFLIAVFTPTDTQLSPLQVSTGLIVRGAPHLTWDPVDTFEINTGLDETVLNATCEQEGTYVYSPALNYVATEFGELELTLTFTPTNETYHYAEVYTRIIEIVRLVPEITWGTLVGIAYDPVDTSEYDNQLNATANVTGTFDYTPAAGTALTAGLHTVQLVFTPDDETLYSPVTVNRTIIVANNKTIITWDDPTSVYFTHQHTDRTDIFYNAEVNAPGTITYSPVLGSLYPVGTHELSLAFYATDPYEYNSPVFVTKTITVVKGTIEHDGAAFSLPYKAVLYQFLWGIIEPLPYDDLLEVNTAMHNSTYYIDNVELTSSNIPTVGTHILKTVMSGFNSYNTKDGFVSISLLYNFVDLVQTITVIKGTFIFDWSISDFRYDGTSTPYDRQLNYYVDPAVQLASVVWDPPAGTILQPGTYDVTITATPVNTDELEVFGETRKYTITSGLLLSWVPATTSKVCGEYLDSATLNAITNLTSIITYTRGGVTIATFENNTLTIVDQNFCTTTEDLDVTIVATAHYTGEEEIPDASISKTFLFRQIIPQVICPVITLWYEESITPEMLVASLVATDPITTNQIPGTFYGYRPDKTEFVSEVPVFVTLGFHYYYLVRFQPDNAVKYRSNIYYVRKVTINKKGITITADSKNKIYLDDNPEFTYTVTGLVDGDTVSGSLSCNAIKTTGVGTYDILQGTVAPDISNKYIVTYVKGTLKINKKQQVLTTLTLDNSSITVYTNTKATVASNNTDNSIYFTVSPDGICSVLKTTTGFLVTTYGTGIASIHAYQPSSANWLSAQSNTVTLTVKKKIATITLGNLSVVYNGSQQGITYTCDILGVTVQVKYNGNTIKPINAGEYTVVAEIINSDLYEASIADIFTIAKVTPTVTFSLPVSIDYPTTLNGLLTYTASIPGTGVFKNESETGSTVTNATVPNPDSGYVIYLIFTPTDTVNYNTVTVWDGMIVKGPVVITWNTPSAITYGTYINEVILNANTNVLADLYYYAVTGELTQIAYRLQGSQIVLEFHPARMPAAGSHTLRVIAKPLNTSLYLDGSADVTLVVQKYSTQINFTNITCTAGNTLNNLFLSAQGTGPFGNIDGSYEYILNGSVIATEVNDVFTGSYEVQYSDNGKSIIVNFTPDDTTNYTVTSKTITLTVIQHKITVTPTSNLSKSYGFPDPVFTYTYTYTGPAPTITGALGHSSHLTNNKENVGTYAIVKNTLDTVEGYSVILVPGIFTVVKAPQVISNYFFAVRNNGIAFPRNLVYGDIVDLTATGGDSGNALIFTSSATGLANFISDRVLKIYGSTGTFTITVTQNGNNNYLPATPLVMGPYTVAKIAVVITVTQLEYTYTGNPVVLQYTCVPAMPVTVSWGVGNAPTNLGTYNVVLSVDSNVYSGIANVWITITAKQFAVYIDDKTITFGDSPSYTYTTADAPYGFICYIGATNWTGSAGTYIIDVLSDNTPYGYDMVVFTGILKVNKRKAYFTSVALSYSNGLPVKIDDYVYLSATYYGEAQIITDVINKSIFSLLSQWSARAIAAGASAFRLRIPESTNYFASDWYYTKSVTVNKKTIGVYFSTTYVTYTGGGLGVGAYTNTPVSSIVVMYNGSITLPVAPGSYNVIATIVDSTYQGSATTVFTIAKAVSNIGFDIVDNSNITFGTSLTGILYASCHDLFPALVNQNDIVFRLDSQSGVQVYENTLLPVKWKNFPGPGAYDYSWDCYTIYATYTPSDTNYTSDYDYSFICIDPRVLTATFSLPLKIPANTPIWPYLNPVVNSGVAGTWEYRQNSPYTDGVIVSGNTTYPETGTPIYIYAIFTPLNNNYMKAYAGDYFYAEKITVTIYFSTTYATYTGGGLGVGAYTNISVGSIVVTYNGSNILPVAAGSYNVVATIVDNNYKGSATTVFTILKASSTIGFDIVDNSSITYGTTLSGILYSSCHDLFPALANQKDIVFRVDDKQTGMQINENTVLLVKWENYPGPGSYDYHYASYTIYATYTPSDTNYTSDWDYSFICINPKALTVTFSLPLQIPSNTPIGAYLNPTVSPDVVGTWEYRQNSPYADGVIVSGNTVYPESSTAIYIYAIFTPLDINYTKAYVGDYFYSEKITPNIVWNPSKTNLITYEPFTESILNAYVEGGIPGSITYTNLNSPGGSVYVGYRCTGDNYNNNMYIVCTFTPTDSGSYDTVNVYKDFSVNYCQPTIGWNGNLNIFYFTSGSVNVPAYGAVAYHPVTGENISGYGTFNYYVEINGFWYSYTSANLTTLRQGSYSVYVTWSANYAGYSSNTVFGGSVTITVTQMSVSINGNTIYVYGGEWYSDGYSVAIYAGDGDDITGIDRVEWSFGTVNPATYVVKYILSAPCKCTNYNPYVRFSDRAGRSIDAYFYQTAVPRTVCETFICEAKPFDKGDAYLWPAYSSGVTFYFSGMYKHYVLEKNILGLSFTYCTWFNGINWVTGPIPYNYVYYGNYYGKYYAVLVSAIYCQ